MKQLLLLAVCASLLGTAPKVHAQAGVDDLLNNPININMIGSANDGLVDPIDLDFNRDEGRENELWVLNQGYNTGGTTVTYYNPGTADQTSEFMQDGNGWHFMAHAAALAFGDNETWGTAQNITDANRSNRDFIWAGPSMWSTDLDIHAVDHGRNGSHLDMLHMSPASSGIAAETGNVFWVFDGVFGDVLRVDFAEPHEPGGDFHGDGRVRRYTEVDVEHNGDIPCHMVMDDQLKWLYVVDGGNRRIVRVDISTGSVAGSLPLLNPETLAEYTEVTGVNWEVYIDSDLVMPSGIDFKDGRLLVGDNATGEIVFFDVTGESPVEMGRIQTNAANLMGIIISPNDDVFFVDHDRAEVGQIALAGDFDLAIDRNVIVVPNASSTVAYTIENTSGADMTFNATLTGAAPRTPSVWEVSVAAGTVAAGATETFEMTVDPSAFIGLGQYQLSVTVDGQDAIPAKSKLITFVSDAVDLLVVNDVLSSSRGDASLGVLLYTIVRPSTIEVNSAIAVDIIPELSNLKSVVWTAGSFGTISSLEADIIETAMLDGVNVMFMADLPLFEIAANSDSEDDLAGPEFLGAFGAEMGGPILSGLQLGTASLSGISGDPISNALGNFSARLTAFNNGGRMTSIPSPSLRPTNENTRPFILYSQSPDSAVALRSIGENSRSAIIGIPTVNFPDRSIRNTVLRETIAWMESADTDGTPAISVSTNGINFGAVPVGANRGRSVTIENTGDGILDIYGLNISANADVFEFDDEIGVPLFIAPGEDLELEITFRPTNTNPIIEDLTIVSNAGDDIKVTLMGNVVSSVTPVDGRSDALSIEIGPNPLSAAGTIRYEVRGSAKQATIEIVDASGRTIQRLLNGTITPGEYQLELDASTLADGNYFLILSTDTEAVFTRLTRIR